MNFFNKLTKGERIKQSEFGNTVLASPILIIERLLKEDNVKPQVNIFDVYGNVHKGSIEKLDNENKMLLLSNVGKEGAQLSFIKTDLIAAVDLFQAQDHLEALVGKVELSEDFLDLNENFNIEDYIEQLEGSFKRSLNHQFEISLFSEEGTTEADQKNIKIVLDFAHEAILSVSQEELGKDALQSIKTFELVNSKGKPFSLKKKASKLVLTLDLNEKLTTKLPRLINENLERIL